MNPLWGLVVPNERNPYPSINQVMQNYQKVHSSISNSAWPGIKPKLVIVTKNQPIELITQLAERLATPILGENRVQETMEKLEKCPSKNIEWHFIGHLQRNKVKKIIGKVTLIHSLDSLSLAKEIEKRASHSNIIVNCLLQVDISCDGTKYGLQASFEKIKDFLNEIMDFSNIRILGLMTMAPYIPPEETRKYFHQMRNLYDRLKRDPNNPKHTQMKMLSMGMSNDFQVALQEGSTMVRLGTVLFN